MNSEASVGWRSSDEMRVDRCGVGGRAFVEGGANITYRMADMQCCDRREQF